MQLNDPVRKFLYAEQAERHLTTPRCKKGNTEFRETVEVLWSWPFRQPIEIAIGSSHVAVRARRNIDDDFSLWHDTPMSVAADEVDREAELVCIKITGTPDVRHLRAGSFAAQSTFNCFLSSKIADQDDIAAGFAARKQQLRSIGRPIKIEDSARTKFGELMWLAAYHRLFP
jgi:hypothetical protein